MKKILVVAPHPDDETLGCGGTLLRHIDEGDKVHWLIGTTIAEEMGFPKERIREREQEIIKVASAYGFEGHHQMEFLTTSLDQVPRSELIAGISNYLSKVQPDTLYLPYRNDIHSDHAQIFDATLACTKSFRYPFLKRVRVYETLSETEFGMRTDDPGFKPNLWVNVSDYMNKKIEIMNIYESEMGKHPFPRSEDTIEALAKLRGSTAGVSCAEAFQSIKEII